MISESQSVIFGSLALGLFMSLVIIRSFNPQRLLWDKFKVLGLVVAVCGITLQVGLYLYNHWIGLAPTERIQLRLVAAKSEAQACQAAGYSANGYFWDSVHNHFSSHHFYKGSFASRLMCLGENHLVHEIFPPKCNARNLKACR